jgi:tRNA threonylcarbamoyladenosine biosynthesis protein TsaE
MQLRHEELGKAAAALVRYAEAHAKAGRATVIAFAGDLGAGKTSLVQKIAESLGVMRDVPSPTFVLMRSYETAHPRFKRLVHIDAYRLEDERELAPLHLEEVFADGEALVCVEWPKRLFGALPKERLDLALSVIDERTRELGAPPDLESYLQKAIQVV